MWLLFNSMDLLRYWSWWYTVTAYRNKSLFRWCWRYTRGKSFLFHLDSYRSPATPFLYNKKYNKKHINTKSCCEAKKFIFDIKTYISTYKIMYLFTYCQLVLSWILYFNMIYIHMFGWSSPHVNLQPFYLYMYSHM